MDRTQRTEIVNMCMVRRGDEVLVLDKIHKEWGGYTFPGGHVEREESFTDAVIREVYEETGLTITSPVLCGVKDWVNEDGSRYLVMLYQADRFSGKLQASREGEVFWMPLAELLSSEQMSLDMKDLLKVFIQDDLSEFFYYLEDGRWNYLLK